MKVHGDSELEASALDGSPHVDLSSADPISSNVAFHVLNRLKRFALVVQLFLQNATVQTSLFGPKPFGFRAVFWVFGIQLLEQPTQFLIFPVNISVQLGGPSAPSEPGAFALELEEAGLSANGVTLKD